MDLSPYLYLSRFSFSCCTFFVIITPSFSPFQVSILLYFFVLFKKIPCYGFFCSLQISSLSLSSQYWIFLSISYRLLINLYIVIMSSLSLLSSNVFRCISFNLSLYVYKYKLFQTLFLSLSGACIRLYGNGGQSTADA